MGKILTPEEAAAAGLPEDAEEGAVFEASDEPMSPRVGMGDVRERDDEPTPDIAGLQADLSLKAGLHKADKAQSRVAAMEKLLAAMQTGSLGLGDEMAGAKEALSGGDYHKSQKAAEATAKDAQRKHPLASLAGIVPHMFVPGAGTVGGRLATAGYGGLLSGFGEAEGGESASDVAKDSGEGALKSMAIQGGLEIASPLLGKAYRYLKNEKAPQLALKAAGLRGGIKNVPQSIGLEGEDAINAMGREVLDQGLIPVAGSKQSVANRAEALRQQSGNLIGQAIQKGEMSGVPANYDDAAWAAIQPAMEGTVLARNKSGGPVRDLLRALSQQAVETPGSYAALNATKSDMGKNVNWNAVPKGTGALHRKTYGALNEEIANQLGKAAGPEAAQMLREGNKGYGLASDVLKLANDQGGREIANSSLGLREMLMGGTGAGVGATLGGPAGAAIGGPTAALLANLSRKYGPALGARALDDVGAPALNALSRVNQLPAAVGAVQSLTPDEENRENLARYLELLASQKP